MSTEPPLNFNNGWDNPPSETYYLRDSGGFGGLDIRLGNGRRLDH